MQGNVATPSTNRAWLNNLYSMDRIFATRWLNEPGGEARLRRIAAALPKKAKGRTPTTSARRDELRRALMLHITTPGLDFSVAAGQIYDALPQPVGMARKTYTNSFGREFKKLPLAYISELAVEADRNGAAVRGDLFPDLGDLFPGLARNASARAQRTARFARLKAEYDEIGFRILDRICITNDRLRDYHERNTRLLSGPLTSRLAAFKSNLERWRREEALCDAFPEILHDDLFVHEVSEFFDWVAEQAAARFPRTGEHGNTGINVLA